jgi:hypothetical protein
MAKLDNPAGRLYEVLNAARSMPATHRVGGAWAEVFDVEPTDIRSIYALLVELMDLADRAKKSVQQLPDVDHDLYLRWVPNVERVLTHSQLAVKWAELQSHLDKLTMNQLEYCSDLLSQRMGEKVISDEDLSKLQMEVETLLEKVLNANLPQELTAVLTQKLEDIRQAILAYRVTGNEGLRQAVESGFGAIVLYREHIQGIQDEEQKTTLHDVLEFMAHLAQIGGFVLQAVQLTAPFIPLLGPGKHDSKGN